MNCEACLPLLDEFFDGELESRLVSGVRSHIAGCASCSDYCESLRMGQDVYDRFLDDVKISATAWHGVTRRIHENKITNTGGLFAGVFAKLNRRFIPGFERAVVGATLVLLVLLGVVALRLLTRPEHKQVASVEPTRIEPQKQIVPKVSVEQPLLKDQLSEFRKPQRIAKPLERVNASEKRSVVTSEAQAVAMLEKAAAFSRAMESARSELEASRPLTLKTDVARHFEKTRLLLLSLKNTPTPETDTSINLTYEKTLSRKLANNNSLLRQETAIAGDQSRAELLDRIEPLLIEIANMPDRASRDEVALISRHIVRRDVIELLQLQTF